MKSFAALNYILDKCRLLEKSSFPLQYTATQDIKNQGFLESLFLTFMKVRFE